MNRLALAIAVSIAFGLGCMYGTIVTVRADIARAVREQREISEAAAQRKGAEAAKAFRAKE
jgi:hypothetical protein